MKDGGLTVYRGCTPVVDAYCGPDTDRTPTEAVIEALGKAAGVDPVELPQLYEFVDGDALDALFERHGGAEAAEALLSFRVETWNVFVRADGRIRVCDATKATDPEPVFGSNAA